MDKNAELLAKLKATFQIEAEEHLRAISSGLLELENAPVGEQQARILESAFREAHSLKGAARVVNMGDIETICQSLETVFSDLKRQAIGLSRSLFDRLHQAVDAMGKLLLPAGSEQNVGELRIEEIKQNLQAILDATPLPRLKQPRREEKQKVLSVKEGSSPVFLMGAESQPVSEERPQRTERRIRVSEADLDSVLRQTEELVAAKLSGTHRAAELREIAATLAHWGKERAKINADLRAVRQSLQVHAKRNGHARLSDRQAKANSQMTKVLAFLDWNDLAVRSERNKLKALATFAEQDHRTLCRKVDDLLEGVKRVSMLPFSSLTQVFPKMVRDLSRDRGKDVVLAIQGDQIEAERRILEEMKDPLIHILRNSIDHGIEDPQDRKKKMKPPRATITLAISPIDGDKVEILISDDGAGINVQKVRDAAIRQTAVSPERPETMSEQAALSLIFQSGVSTSPILTETSGRGLGLAIVQEKVEKLAGTVAVETVPDRGTAFRIRLPLTRATFRGVLVRVEDRDFILPTRHVDRVVSLSEDEIKTVENRETMDLDGQALSLVWLGEILGLPRKRTGDNSVKTHSAVVLSWAEKCIGFLVDEILGEQEVLVKSLGKQLSRVRNVAGAAVMGAGKVVPVLNVPDLMHSAVTAAGTARPAAPKETKAQRKSILVVEDSITARMLLKNILEAAGFSVKSAVDGLDAFTALRAEDFDLVVSDVEMPRMNGFEITAKIRADKRLAELPVVLVTALQSREDQERGIDVGANAYIVKSSFDQGNLLEVIRRLI